MTALIYQTCLYLRERSLSNFMKRQAMQPLAAASAASFP
jgi:hypothetical protein